MEQYNALAKSKAKEFWFRGVRMLHLTIVSMIVILSIVDAYGRWH